MAFKPIIYLHFTSSRILHEILKTRWHRFKDKGVKFKGDVQIKLIYTGTAGCLEYIAKSVVKGDTKVAF